MNRSRPAKIEEPAYRWSISELMDLLGPISLSGHVALSAAEDGILLVFLALWRAGSRVPFEGSYGFANDFVTYGQQRLSHAELDPELSRNGWPVHTHESTQTLSEGKGFPIDVSLLSQATRVLAGDDLVLRFAGRWPIPTNPVHGQFPAKYEGSKGGELTIDPHRTCLEMPVRSI